MSLSPSNSSERLCQHLEGSFRILEALGAEVTVRIGPGYPPVVNDAQITEWVQSAAADLVGDDATLPIEPMTLAEDFSFLAREAPGTFFFLGAAPAEP